MNLKLKFAILKKFKSQADFAQKIRCHESKVSQVICGRRKLDQNEAKQWAKALNCNPSIINH